MQLCQSEWTVLQSLWERQPQTLMQLVEDLKLRAGWSASTSKTMAARMTEKGLLRYEGKPRRYYPNVTREEAGLEETEQLLSRAFGGKLGLLVSNFADHGKIGKDELEELYARISVQLRKASPQFEFDDVIQYKELKISKQKHTVSVKEHELNFTRQEFKILELLLSKKDKVFSKQEIYDYAWDNYYMGEDKTVNVHISHIRSKIKQYTEEEYIETVWGIGFKIAD